uniref:Uncharacterized protein n=1 Tax=Kofleria flava TaxID=694315 RepID=A0A3S5GXM2_9BACT|nr:hypothetical protein [Kofleria flava]
MKRLMLASALSTVTLFGCAAEETDPGTPPPDDIDQTLLAEYRKALPSMGQLGAKAPEGSAASILAVGDPALYPTSSYDIATGINGAVTGIVQLLDDVTSIQPTIFNSETNEFFWGPFPNEDGIGYVAAYIREGRPDADFQFEYALLRGIDNDVAKLTPVIWGGATPDAENEDHGAGVTLWDFEANRAFEEEHNPDFANLVLDRGRFVALYAAGQDENDPEAEAVYVLATFRNFVSIDNPTAEPANLDYFYGHYEKEIKVDFLDWEASFDVTEPADGLAENVGVRMAFLNEGTGRAEADAAGGSLAEGQEASVVECWNAAIEQSYISFDVLEGGETIASAEEGNFADCGLFTASLDDLGVPSLDDVDPGLRAILDEVARNGVIAE